jgi:hypothetical protein
VKARDQLQPTLSRDSQLFQDRGFVGWDPSDLPCLELVAGPLQQFGVLCADHVQASQV